MSNRWLFTISSVLVAGALLLWATARHTVHADPGCSPASIVGTYGFAINGLTNPGSSNAQTISSFYPIAAAGTFTFDGTATVSRSFTVSFGGAIFPVTDSGTYSIDSTCSGSAVFPNAQETWNLVVVSGGKGIDTVIATPGRVVAGILSRQ
jgi:hypothetical protein